MGIGIGVGAAGVAATAVGGMYNDALSSIANTTVPESKEPVVPGDILDGVGLDNIGSQETSASAKSDVQVKSKKDRLIELKEYFEMELITKEEFEAKKAEILSEI